MTQANYEQYLDETCTAEQLEYLTVPCKTRSKATAYKMERLLREGKFGRAMKLGDPIAYNVGRNDMSRPKK